MTENMKIWDAVKQPPPEALKKIEAGRIKGMTDINPQWRYHVMTEQFGVCGIGWKYSVVRTWNEIIPDGQIMAHAEIALFIKVDGEWSDPIPGIGGSMLVSKEREGLHASDEGYKMAITDALSVAMKMLGVGANIYAGLSDSKYSPKPQSTPAPIKKESSSEAQAKADKEAGWPPGPIHAAEAAVKTEDMALIKASLKKTIWNEKTWASWLVSTFHLKGGLLEDVIAQMNPEQKNEWAQKVKEKMA